MFSSGDERPKSRGCGRVTYHQETRDPQLACIFLFVGLSSGIFPQHRIETLLVLVSERLQICPLVFYCSVNVLRHRFQACSDSEC